MWTSDLWAIGLTGAVVGGALGWPLLRWQGPPAGANLRLLGAMLLIGAAAVACISAAHGDLLPPLTAWTAGHLLYAGDLVFWSLLVTWVRGATGRTTTAMMRAAVVGVPLAAYAALTAAQGFARPSFIWLLPAGYAAATYTAALWWRAPADEASMTRAIATRMVGIAVALNSAQTLRTFWPQVELWREIVPITMTAGFLSIGALAMRSLGSARRPGAEPAAARYERSAIDAGTAAALLAALERGMRDDRWYRDPTLTLAALADKLQTRSHVLSQVLNQHAGRTFTDYLVGWRVADARALLEDAGNDRFTIDALAGTAGFASRSAFYKAFRDIEGTTPTAYRARARATRWSAS